MDQHTNAIWPGWEVVRTIGHGSFGAVYEIRRDMFGDEERAALKVLHIPQNRDEIQELRSLGYDDASITTHFKGYLGDIVREYSLMNKMKGHTNVVYCDDIRYEQNADGIGWDIYIKMELLTPLMSNLGAVATEEQVVRLGKDLCNALVLCKERNIVHRDIKPQNIFMSDTGDFKLGDFGVAKTVERTTGGTKIGTYKYMAPEVYNNQPYGHSSDIYALGLVMYWLLNEKRTPFLPMPPQIPTAAMEDTARLRRFTGEDIPAPAAGSAELQRIVLKACAFDPKDRYASAADMLAELKALKPSSNPIATAVPPTGTAATATAATAATAKISRPVEEEGTINIFSRTAKPVQEPPTEFGSEDRTEYIRDDKTECIPRAVAAQQPPKKKNRWLIPAIVVVVVFAIILLLLRSCGSSPSTEPSGTTGTPTTSAIPETTLQPTTQPPTTVAMIDVPNVAGKEETEATAELETLGFVVVVHYEKADSVPEGNVISQDVEAGTQLEPGTEIVLVVSSGKPSVAVADVVGKTEKEAKSTLEKQGFKVTVVEKNSDTVAKGKVISQSVEAGTQLVIGSEIRLTVSSGKPSVAVADVVGKTEKEAKTILEKQGFMVTVVEKNSDTVAEGKVISQSPKAGSQQVIGSEIQITVSIGKQALSVANVVGKTKAQAKATLEDQGFQVTFQEEYSATVAEGNVIRQDPAAGTKKYAGDTITVVISKGPIVPSGVSLNKSSATLQINATLQLTASVSPSDAHDKSLTWSSSNTAVATVSANGLVTAKAPGTATITVKTNSGGKTATCTITVSKPTIGSISNVTLFIGDTAYVSLPSVTPAWTDVSAFSLQSSSSSVVAVSISSSNRIYLSCKAAGTATVTVSYTAGGTTVKTTFTVTVNTPKVTLSSYSGSETRDVYVDDYNFPNLNYQPGWKVKYPTATANTGSVVSWELASGQGLANQDCFYIFQPKQAVVVRAYFYYNGTKYYADYTYTLRLTKTMTASNVIRSGPGKSYSSVGTVAKGVTKEFLEIAWTPSKYADGEYWMWGRIGTNQWIVIF